MKEIESVFKHIPGINPLSKSPGVTPSENAGKNDGGFASELTNAIREVDSLQTKADQSITDLVTGAGDITTHDAMIALEKADIAFNLMTQIRSKIVRAYEEVMRTQV
jgi:flagellar hook-basal body complex protein FliE